MKSINRLASTPTLAGSPARQTGRAPSLTMRSALRWVPLDCSFAYPASGSLADRLWASYAITVTGLDVPTVSGAINAVQPVARARVTIRVPPAGDPKTTTEAVVAFLRQVAPWGVRVSFNDHVLGSGFLADTGGVARSALNRAMERAYGRSPRDVGAGGSIPLVSTLVRQFPAASILLFGAEDDDASIHAPNERVVIDELRRTITTEALFLQEYGSAPF
ncbi:hypothetical protein ACFQ08_34975 [Streptosporangium algeriense]|uniref:Peptidase M20 dimerisation domain-containing protein n=1 Tax=Streptosporangium algeriense TaxID=1682748 RepID=A0ABW3E2U2_9ACTN